MKGLSQWLPHRFWRVILISQILLFLLLCSFSLYYLSREKTSLLIYLAGSTAILLVSILVNIVIGYRVFLPRLRQFQKVFDQLMAGNFAARIGAEAYADKPDLMVSQVNQLIETVELYIGNLKGLTNSVEALANAINKDEIHRVAAELIEKQLKVSCIGIYQAEDFAVGRVDHADVSLLNESSIAKVMSGKVQVIRETKKANDDAGARSRYGVLICVPVIEDGQVNDVMVFTGPSRDLRLDPVSREFARTLSRFMGSAFSRIKSLHEITAAERRYRALFLRADCGIFRTGSGGRMTEVNPALVTMFGFSTAEEMIGAVGDGSALFENTDTYRNLQQDLESRDHVRIKEVSLFRKDGSRFPASLSAHAVRNRYGNLRAVEGYVLDLSERPLSQTTEAN